VEPVMIVDEEISLSKGEPEKQGLRYRKIPSPTHSVTVDKIFLLVQPCLFFFFFKEIFFIINNLLTKKLWGMYGIISKF
jgi:hypothetical protein